MSGDYPSISIFSSAVFSVFCIHCGLCDAYLQVSNAWMVKVLKNGSEVKLQRNALSVLEHPTGNEVDDDNDYDTSSGSDIGEHDFCMPLINQV